VARAPIASASKAPLSRDDPVWQKRIGTKPSPSSPIRAEASSLRKAGCGALGIVTPIGRKCLAIRFERLAVAAPRIERAQRVIELGGDFFRF
jgi:hypothetical protein